MSRKILLHLGIWLTFISLFIFEVYSSSDLFSMRPSLILLFNLLLFYFNYLVLVPRLLLKKKITHYIISLLVIFILILIVQEFIFEGPPQKFRNPPDFNRPKPPIFNFLRFLFPLIMSLSFVVIGTTIRMYEQWNRSMVEEKEIEAFKTRTELHYLKNQLSPHFLFNSLNSIYSLIYNKSEEASEAVIMLSELMRYMLYQADKDFVALTDELNYMQNYVRLQRLRIANNENVMLNIHGAVTHQKIRPLLLISFIENAFKYGTDYKGNTQVRIVIHVTENVLKFSCKNLIGSRKKDLNNSGIGLQNTRERIKLLYGDKHTLNVYEEDSSFIVNLELNLD